MAKLAPETLGGGIISREFLIFVFARAIVLDHALGFTVCERRCISLHFHHMHG